MTNKIFPLSPTTFERGPQMKNILLTNDDGIFSPGLAALYRELTRLGKVWVVAPAAEQSGVAQSVTFRIPLLVKDVFVGGERWGWGVEGTPTDCVKVGVNVVCPEKPDLVVSGINWGQNCGTNILYSGTLGAAFEGGLYHIPSFAVSIQDDKAPNFDRAAALAVGIIEQIYAKIQEEPAASDPCGNPDARIFNINISREAVKEENPPIVIAPMDTTPYATGMAACSDTFGRMYYWLTPNPRDHRPDCPTDMNELGAGKIVITPLRLDVTYTEYMSTLRGWDLQAREASSPKQTDDFPNVPAFSMRTTKKYDPEREA